MTLWQPWASLIAAGIKTIETRSWRTSYRGPLAIHASQRKAKWDDITRLWRPAWPESAGRLVAVGLPAGVVVATCELVDCCPIGGPEDFRTGLVDGDAGDWPGQAVLVSHGPLWAGDTPRLVLDRPAGTEDVSDQLPFGDWTPGRWGWLLDKIEPLAEPVPARGRQGLWTWEGP